MSNVTPLRRGPAVLDHSVEAEQAVLGALLIDEKALDAIDKLDPQWFFLLAHQEIARAVLELARRRLPFDPVTVHQALEAQRRIPDAVPADMVFALGKGIGTSGNVRHYVEIVRKTWALRQARILCAHFATDLDLSEPHAAIGALQRDLAGIELGDTAPILTAGQLVADLVEALDEERQGKPGTELISTGFPAIDELTGGFEAGVLQVYAARPHSGKTALAVSFAAALGAAGVPTGVFWWEDSARKFAARSAAVAGQIPTQKLRHGKGMHAPWWERLMATADRMLQWPLYVDPTKGVTAQEAVQRIRRMHREKGIRVLITDHLGEVRINRDNGLRDDIALGEAARAIRDECDRLKICPVLFHQLGRLAETEKVPRLGWLANSDVLGQAARTVGFLSLDNPADEDAPGTLRIQFVKGPPGKHVELRFERRTMAIVEHSEPAQRDLAV